MPSAEETVQEGKSRMGHEPKALHSKVLGKMQRSIQYGECAYGQERLSDGPGGVL